MDIIILAGGLGTRLKNVVNEVPKVMAPVEGKPFLEYTLEYLNKFDINNVILAVSGVFITLSPVTVTNGAFVSLKLISNSCFVPSRIYILLASISW